MLFRSASQQRKPVAYLICSAAKRRMLGVMWLWSALARSRGRTCHVPTFELDSSQRFFVRYLRLTAP